MHTNRYTALSGRNGARSSRHSRVNAQSVSSLEIDAPRNSLLARLPKPQLSRLLPYFERVDMQLGDVICQSGAQSQHVYFPITAIVSLLYGLKDGLSAEMAIVGNEGVIGIGLFMAGENSPGQAEVRCAGQGLRLNSRVLQEQWNGCETLRHVLLCYVQALLVEISLNAGCNRHHTVTQQLCRYLLLNLDRSSGRQIALTQEAIAASLGVRRETVTGAAGKLRQANLIDYRRGHITILDRDGLESKSCECYLVGKKALERLLLNRIEVQPATSGARFAAPCSAHSARLDCMAAARVQ
jgi:CRP-like cAMP-binding protein